MTIFQQDNRIPLHRIAVVRSFTRFLEDIGAPVEQGFRRARLPVHALENDDNYVPSDRFWAFLVDMARREHMEDLGFRVGKAFGVNCPDPNIVEILGSTPTLYRGLSAAFAFANSTVTNCTMGLAPSARAGYTCVFHSPSCAASNPAVEQIGWFGLMWSLGMLREYVGGAWQPTEIGLMTRRTPNRHIRDTFPDSRIRYAMPASYLEIPNSMLSLPPRRASSADDEDIPFSFSETPANAVGSLKKLVASYVQEPGFSVKDAAALCDTSARSLQRFLKHCGTTYSDVLDETRFQVASRMLRQPEIRVATIASRLGYADPTNFSRAFRRIAGVSPRQYRHAHASPLDSRLH